MQIKNTISGSRAVLALDGRFDFNSHRDFRAACEALMGEAAVKEVEVNFGGVDYLDSSALGMLLLLREKAEAQSKSVVLSGLQGTVKQVLDVANFNKLFTVKE